MIENVQWTEKYRPGTLDEVGLDPGTRKALESYIKKGEIPHLLLEGPAGCGKTTVAKILIRSLDCHYMILNASMERGIDTVRSKVSHFARGSLGKKWNIIFLDEADYITHEAQAALRNTMESVSHLSRFILTCNFSQKIIDAIRSRCQVFTMGSIPFEERARILKHVLDSEKVKYEPKMILYYAELYTDMRKLLFKAQKDVLTGKLAQAEEEPDGKKLWAAIQAKDWNQFKAVARLGSVDHSDLLRQLFWMVPDSHPKAFDLRVKIARAVTASSRALDPVIHFLGTCCELAQEI